MPIDAKFTDETRHALCKTLNVLVKTNGLQSELFRALGAENTGT